MTIRSQTVARFLLSPILTVFLMHQLLHDSEVSRMRPQVEKFSSLLKPIIPVTWSNYRLLAALPIFQQKPQTSPLHHIAEVARRSDTPSPESIAATSEASCSPMTQSWSPKTTSAVFVFSTTCWAGAPPQKPARASSCGSKTTLAEPVAQPCFPTAARWRASRTRSAFGGSGGDGEERFRMRRWLGLPPRLLLLVTRTGAGCTDFRVLFLRVSVFLVSFVLSESYQHGFLSDSVPALHHSTALVAPLGLYILRLLWLILRTTSCCYIELGSCLLGKYIGSSSWNNEILRIDLIPFGHG
jgi:hypothetical protein